MAYKVVGKVMGIGSAFLWVLYKDHLFSGSMSFKYGDAYVINVISCGTPINAHLNDKSQR